MRKHSSVLSAWPHTTIILGSDPSPLESWQRTIWSSVGSISQSIFMVRMFCDDKFINRDSITFNATSVWFYSSLSKERQSIRVQFFVVFIKPHTIGRYPKIFCLCQIQTLFTVLRITNDSTIPRYKIWARIIHQALICQPYYTTICFGAPNRVLCRIEHNCQTLSQGLT